MNLNRAEEEKKRYRILIDATDRAFAMLALAATRAGMEVIKFSKAVENEMQKEEIRQLYGEVVIPSPTGILGKFGEIERMPYYDTRPNREGRRHPNKPVKLVPFYAQKQQKSTFKRR